MSRQRRRGQSARVWRSVLTIDARGNEVRAPNDLNSHVVRAAFIPQRSAKAEVPGQQQINVVRMIVDADLPEVDLFSRVEWRGEMWDVVVPPQYHHGTRQNRHWSVDLRQRP